MAAWPRRSRTFADTSALDSGLRIVWKDDAGMGRPCSLDANRGGTLNGAKNRNYLLQYRSGRGERPIVSGVAGNFVVAV